MRKSFIIAVAIFLTSLIANAQPVGLVVNSTPVVGGTNGNCLNITAGKVGSAACGGGGGITVNTTTITGGTTGTLLYDKAGTVGESAMGTLTANTPLTLSQTWNNNAVSFNALVIDITDSAPYGGSPPYPSAFEVRKGGTPQIAIGIDGWFYPKGSYPLMGPSADGQALNFYNAGDPSLQIRGNGYYARTGMQFGFGQSDSASKAPTSAISGVSAGVMELNNGSPTSGTGSYAQINLGTIQLAPAAAPSAPALSGSWVLYVDSGDGNKLKAIASNGTIALLGTP